MNMRGAILGLSLLTMPFPSLLLQGYSFTLQLHLSVEIRRPTTYAHNYVILVKKVFLTFLNIIQLVYLFWAVLGLRCCIGHPLVVVHGLLIAVAFLATEHRLQGMWLPWWWHPLSSCGSQTREHSLNSCGAWAQLLHGIGDFPRPGVEFVSPALAGAYFTTEPPGKPSLSLHCKL